MLVQRQNFAVFLQLQATIGSSLDIAHRVDEGKARARASLVGPESPLWALTLLGMKYAMSGNLQDKTILPFSCFQSMNHNEV